MQLQIEALTQAIASADRAPAAWPIPPAELLGTIAAVDAIVISMRTGAAATATAPASAAIPTAVPATAPAATTSAA